MLTQLQLEFAISKKGVKKRKRRNVKEVNDDKQNSIDDKTIIAVEISFISCPNILRRKRHISH